jgi:hypothetical protein
MHIKLRMTRAAASQLHVPDDATDGNAQWPADGDRRAPSQGPSLLTPPPALAAATKEHRRHASALLRVGVLRAMATAARNGTDQPKRKKRITRRITSW